jgi:DNA repair protein RadA/Sms
MARSTSRTAPAFRCAECGWTTSKWAGRCGECQAWGTVEQVGAPKAAALLPGTVSAPARPIHEIPVEAATARPTGVDELDRVLGGGLVPGAAVLLAGEPGVGKSTLLLDVAAHAADRGLRALYLTGEESAAQVKLRAERVGAVRSDVWLAAETDLGSAIAQVDAVKPDLVILDSVQTFSTTTIDGAAGGMSQVREVAGAMIRIAKERGIATVLVGHVTKDGSIAGPRLLEHLVDVVLQFEGERHSRLRIVRAVKNRYGATDEVGCFDLHDQGIEGLPDPTGLFLTRHAEPVPGTCVTVALEGRRPLLAEIQALVGEPSKSEYTNARRATSGVDGARISMTLAVLELRARTRLAGRDVYVATVGGMRLAEPAADLAVALAVASAAHGVALPSDLVAVGEVGLAGEVRRVSSVQQRLNEAARLGFKRALVPTGSEAAVSGMEIVEVARLDQALAKVRLVSP